MNPPHRHILPLMLCFALVLGACSKQESIEEQFQAKLVLAADLESGNAVRGVRATSLLGMGDQEAVSGLDIWIASSEEEVLLVEDEERAGLYHGPESFILHAGQEYRLRSSHADELISASTVMPPTMEMVNSSKSFIEANIQGDLVFLDWDNINTGAFNEYFYLIEIVPTADEPEAIMRFSGESTRSTVLSYNAEATLSINDFNYYGQHQVTVYAISKQYEYLFGPQQDLSVDGPSNITGAYGYFLGTSAVRTTLDIR